MNYKKLLSSAIGKFYPPKKKPAEWWFSPSQKMMLYDLGINMELAKVAGIGWAEVMIALWRRVKKLETDNAKKD